MPFFRMNKYQTFSWTKSKLNTKLKVIYIFVLFGRKSELIAIIEVVLWILKFFRYHAIYVVFYLMQQFAYSFNHAAANRLTEWHGNLINAE